MPITFKLRTVGDTANWQPENEPVLGGDVEDERGYIADVLGDGTIRRHQTRAGNLRRWKFELRQVADASRTLYRAFEATVFGTVFEMTNNSDLGGSFVRVAYPKDFRVKWQDDGPGWWRGSLELWEQP